MENNRNYTFEYFLLLYKSKFDIVTICKKIIMFKKYIRELSEEEILLELKEEEQSINQICKNKKIYIFIQNLIGVRMGMYLCIIIYLVGNKFLLCEKSIELYREINNIIFIVICIIAHNLLRNLRRLYMGMIVCGLYCSMSLALSYVIYRIDNNLFNGNEVIIKVQCPLFLVYNFIVMLFVCVWCRGIIRKKYFYKVVN